MTQLTKAFITRTVAVVSGVALAAGALVSVAPVAAAAPGDTTAFDIGQGATPNDVVVGPDGNFWTVNRFANSVSKISTTGQTTTFVVPGVEPNAITVGPDNALWFTYFRTDAIGRMTPDGAVQNFPTGIANGNATDIAVGADGNLWVSLLGAQRVARVTTAGAVTAFSGVGAVRGITSGPTNSNRMYFSAGPDGLGLISLTGDVTKITPPAGTTFVGPVQRIGGNIWYGMTNAQNVSELTRLVNDSSFVQVRTPAITSVNTISVGADDTLFVSDWSNKSVTHVTNAGAIAATYTTANRPNAATSGADGNIWVASGDPNTAGQLLRILSGVVPTNTTAPAISPTSGLAAGAVITANNGQWNFQPSSYSYQWQACSTNDAGSCADIAGATAQTYTVAATDVGKYLRAGVRATNLNGPSQPAYSSLAATGQAPAPAPTPAPAPGGSSASIGGGATMELDAPAAQKRNARKFYEVVFSVPSVQGQVVFEFARGAKKQTKTVVIQEGVAEYRWKTPKKWRTGNTTVTATFVPAAGSPYQAAKVTDRVRIR